MNKAEKMRLFKKMNGRAGLSKRILEIAKEIVEVDSYKRAIIGAGQIRVLAEIAEADSYWHEKMCFGIETENRICNGAKKILIDVYGHRVWEKEDKE